jgi:hypothetical protein
MIYEYGQTRKCRRVTAHKRGRLACPSSIAILQWKTAHFLSVNSGNRGRTPAAAVEELSMLCIIYCQSSQLNRCCQSTNSFKGEVKSVFIKFHNLSKVPGLKNVTKTEDSRQSPAGLCAHRACRPNCGSLFGHSQSNRKVGEWLTSRTTIGLRGIRSRNTNQLHAVHWRKRSPLYRAVKHKIHQNPV